MRLIFLVAALTAVLGLGSCAAGGSPIVQSIQALVSTGGTGVSQAAIPDAPDLRFSYLRVQVAGHPPGLMVLGYVDPDPAGPIEVWYSANRETLRLQNGRVISTTGILQDWSAMHYAPVPLAWIDVTVAGFSYKRQHDAMPGYRYGIREQMKVQSWPTLPPVEVSATLPVDRAANYRWYRESLLPTLGQGSSPSQDSWFAWGKHRGVNQIVYSRQCLAPDFCLTLQRWPLLEEAN